MLKKSTSAVQHWGQILRLLVGTSIPIPYHKLELAGNPNFFGTIALNYRPMVELY